MCSSSLNAVHKVNAASSYIHRPETKMIIEQIGFVIYIAYARRSHETNHSLFLNCEYSVHST